MIISAADAARVTDLAPDAVASMINDKRAVLVDVREDFEYAEEHIRGAMHMPLSKFDPVRLHREHGGAEVVFQCRSGKRSITAALAYEQAAGGDVPLMHLAGGIEAWKHAGKPVVKPGTGPRIPVMRQVQITAGALVTLGVVLGAFVHTAFLGIAGFIGVGLVFAGLSGWCGMAKLLGSMPWNRPAGAPAG
ncbi:MAG: rhodanese-like domain-containing protein [Planctomycetota bacterium]